MLKIEKIIELNQKSYYVYSQNIINLGGLSIVNLLVDVNDFFVHAIEIQELQREEKEKHRLNET
jgi:hypothetical protein